MRSYLDRRYREMPTHEERKHSREIHVLSRKIENARPRIDNVATELSRQLPQKLVERCRRQRQAKYQIVENENKKLFQNLCEIARRPSKCLVDAGLQTTPQKIPPHSRRNISSNVPKKSQMTVSRSNASLSLFTPQLKSPVLISKSSDSKWAPQRWTIHCFYDNVIHSGILESFQLNRLWLCLQGTETAAAQCSVVPKNKNSDVTHPTGAPSTF